MLLLFLHKQQTWELKTLQLCEYTLHLIKLPEVHKGIAEKLHIHKILSVARKLRILHRTCEHATMLKLLGETAKYYYKFRLKGKALFYNIYFVSLLYKTKSIFV